MEEASTSETTTSWATARRVALVPLSREPVFLYAARGLSMLETATIMGQADPAVTWKHYARLFDRSDVVARVRAARASLDG